MERAGRLISMSSDFRAEEHEQHRDRVRLTGSQLKKDMQAEIDSLVAVVARTDSLELLGWLALEHCLGPPEIPADARGVRQHYVEYVQSLILCLSSFPVAILTDEDHELVRQLLDRIHSGLP
jgi:hypothetical protein